MFGLFGKTRNPKASVFEEIFQEQYDYVLRLALNLSGNISDAEDITQEVFIAVDSGLNRFEGKSSLKTWIYRITIRIACRYLSKQKRMDNIDEISESDAGITKEVNTGTQNILTVMLKLPLEQRTLLSLNAIGGLSHQQIADILNVPLGTIGSRLHTARKNLSQLLSQDLS